MKKRFIFLLALAVAPVAVFAAEEGGEHEAKKPPPPLAGSPVQAVMELPIVKLWDERAKKKIHGYVTAWGESVSEVDGHKCWGVALGESRGGQPHVLRRFCVPADGGEVFVESVPLHPEDDITYKPYGKWVTDCQPTADSQGNC